ncbi:MAG: hypothetical protein ACR2GA_03415 [Chloroflexota bacterium]
MNLKLGATAPVLLLGMICLAPAPAIARSSRTARVEVVRQGLAVSLSIPAKQYPVNAIVRATMQVSDETAGAIRLNRITFYGCWGTFPPQAFVMSNRRQMFPPVVLSPDIPICPRPHGGTMDLRAGASLVSHEYLLLRGPQIRAFVLLSSMRQQQLQQQTPFIGTPILTVKLTRGDAPTVRIQRGAAPVAHVLRPPYARGELFIGTGWVRSVGAPSFGVRGVNAIDSVDSSWSRTNSLAVRPKLDSGYSRIVQWHSVVGWLGHSAASIDFRQR